MIISDFKHIESVSAPETLIRQALEWASEHYGDTFTAGAVFIAGNKVKVNFEETELRDIADSHLEAHHRFIDIHVPLTEPESIGWAITDNLSDVYLPYDEERDIEFFNDAPQSTVEVKCGQYAILFPEDAHSPNIGKGHHRKMCIKIPVENQQ